MIELFPNYVELKEASRTYRRFSFTGDSRGPGYCYLKVDIHDDVPVFFCAELVDRSRLSIMGSLTEIRYRAIRQLIREEVVVPTRPRIGLDWFARGEFERKRWQDVLTRFNERSLWITHYPREVHWADWDSYSFVDFPRGCVTFVDLDQAIGFTQLPPSFFDIPYEDLTGLVPREN